MATVEAIPMRVDPLRLGRELEVVRADVAMLAAKVRRLERRAAGAAALDHAIAFTAGALLGALVMAVVILLGRAF